MDQVITDGREAIAIEVEERLQRYLRQYGTGIEVTKVNIDRSARRFRFKTHSMMSKKQRKIDSDI